MPRQARVILLKQIKHDGRWIPAPALFDSKGRVRRDHVRVQSRDEVHPEGSYFIEWREEGRRIKQAAGPDAFIAAELGRRKQAELSAVRNGIIPAPANDNHATEVPERIRLTEALDRYSEYIRYHRSLRTFRTYRPILPTPSKTFCAKIHVDDVERQDLLDFATDCLKKGQKGKSVYNKLVVISQVMKQHGKAKLLNAADWPSFVETVRPIYENAELEKLFKACARGRGNAFQVLSDVRIPRRRGALRHMARHRLQAHGRARDGEAALGIPSEELGGARSPGAATLE